MSKSSRGRPALSLGPEWTVQQIVERSLASGGTDSCTQCGVAVELSESHKRVEVARDVNLMERRLRSEHEHYVFCSDDCADEWLD